MHTTFENCFLYGWVAQSAVTTGYAKATRDYKPFLQCNEATFSVQACDFNKPYKKKKPLVLNALGELATVSVTERRQ